MTCNGGSCGETKEKLAHLLSDVAKVPDQTEEVKEWKKDDGKIEVALAFFGIFLRRKRRSLAIKQPEVYLRY